MRRHVQHPGKVLACILDEGAISQNRLARALGVPPRRVNEIILGKRGISADTAIGLGELFGTDPGMWMRLQDDWDLERARERRAARPRRAPVDRGETSIDYLVELSPGEYGDGFNDWLRRHGNRMGELPRGTAIYDEIDPLDAYADRSPPHPLKRTGFRWTPWWRRRRA